jgi:5-bromo-4-chloroindolyl phosphate hydrolysis protein
VERINHFRHEDMLGGVEPFIFTLRRCSGGIMTVELTREELEFIEESLKYTRKNFEEYQKYPSYEFKQQRLKQVNDVLAKIRDAKRSATK